MEDAISTTSLKVRGYHLDGYGHVNHARYLEFMEEGRWDYFDRHPALMSRLATGDIAFVAVNLNVDYREAAVTGDRLEVATRLSVLGGRSAKMHHEILRQRDGATVVRAELTFVLLDVASNKAMTIDGELRDALAALVVVD